MSVSGCTLLTGLAVNLEKKNANIPIKVSTHTAWDTTDKRNYFYATQHRCITDCISILYACECLKAHCLRVGGFWAWMHHLIMTELLLLWNKTQWSPAGALPSLRVALRAAALPGNTYCCEGKWFVERCAWTWLIITSTLPPHSWVPMERRQQPLSEWSHKPPHLKWLTAGTPERLLKVRLKSEKLVCRKNMILSFF